MVEMRLLDTDRRAEWDAWYVGHQHRLLSIPGIRASQRFEAIHPAASPFVALHQVDSAGVFASPPYLAQAGPGNTGEWRTRMDNWHRNVFDGVDETPDVPVDMRLVLAEDGAELPAGAPVRWMQAVALDRSVARRGLAVMAIPGADALAGRPGLRVLKPLGARLRDAR